MKYADDRSKPLGVPPILFCEPHLHTLQQNVKSRVVTKLVAFKNYELPHHRSSRKLLPAEIDMLPVLANTQHVPKVPFLPHPRPHLSFNDFRFRKEMLNHTGGGIALSISRIAGLLKGLIGRGRVPRCFEGFAEAEHEGFVHVIHSATLLFPQRRFPVLASMEDSDDFDDVFDMVSDDGSFLDWQDAKAFQDFVAWRSTFRDFSKRVACAAQAQT
jgi:hypothetical protein